MIIVIFIIILSTQSCDNQQTKIVSKKNDKISKNIDQNIINSNQNSFADSLGDFDDFWKSFRLAIMKSDTERIMLHCLFPFTYRGPLDDDKMVKIPKTQFPKFFFLFLNQWNGEDLQGSTELDVIKNVEKPIEKNVGGKIRVGDMVFYLKDKKWKLGLIYINNETLESINNLDI